MKKSLLLLFLIGIASCHKDDLVIDDTPAFSPTEIQVITWFENQQLPNGLLASVENGNLVSLYDNALAAMVFMLHDDFTRAEKIFDYFDGRIETELNNGVGGFSQFRSTQGIPTNHRWMGDNAWLLIALNQYHALRGNSRYDSLSVSISTWLHSLQDVDGGLFAGYDANGNLLNYKVTEGNIDAFNAVVGYTSFHGNLLGWLEQDRWDSSEQILVSWPTNPTYLYALDLHPWSYALFPDFPITALSTTDRFLTTQTATSGEEITGFCFDVDKDVVWLEGTGQMALAYGLANLLVEKELYLSEIEKLLLTSSKYENSAGFPYASNQGTAYGADQLWSTADTEIAISSGAWYVFAKQGFNPFSVERDKSIPPEEMFWIE